MGAMHSSVSMDGIAAELMMIISVPSVFSSLIHNSKSFLTHCSAQSGDFFKSERPAE